MNFVRQIEMMLNLKGIDHGASCQDVLSGTIGELVERIQGIAMSAFAQGQRDSYEKFLALGIVIPCPVCDRPIATLAEAALMCEDCYYD